MGTGRGKDLYLVLEFVPQTLYSVLYNETPLFSPKVEKEREREREREKNKERERER